MVVSVPLIWLPTPRLSTDALRKAAQVFKELCWITLFRGGLLPITAHRAVSPQVPACPHMRAGILQVDHGILQVDHEVPPRGDCSEP